MRVYVNNRRPVSARSHDGDAVFTAPAYLSFLGITSQVEAQAVHLGDDVKVADGECAFANSHV